MTNMFLHTAYFMLGNLVLNSENKKLNFCNYLNFTILNVSILMFWVVKYYDPWKETVRLKKKAL